MHQFSDSRLRARIKELRVDGEDVSVSVDARELTIDDLIVQIACKKRGVGYRHSGDLRPGDGMPKFSAGFVPDEACVYLLNSKDGKRIDSKEFGTFRSPMTDGITVTNVGEKLGCNDRRWREPVHGIQAGLGQN